MKHIVLSSAMVACLMASCQDDPKGISFPDYDWSANSGSSSEVLTDPSEPLDQGFIHLKARELKSLNVISSSSLSDNERVLVSTLAGLAARVSGDQIYINEGGPSAVWLKEMEESYGIRLKTHSTWASLLTHYLEKEIIKGYIVYKPYSDGKSHSVNVATSLCGLLRGVAVTQDMVPRIRSLGVTAELANVCDRDEKWLYENYGDQLDKSFAVDLKPEIYHHMRDYASMTNAFVFYDYNAKRDWTWRSEILSNLDEGAFCFGYYDADEWGMVNNASSLGVTMLPSDLAANIASMSGIHDTNGLKQREAAKNVTTEENVHYVTFLVSDGDNISFNLWSMQQYFTDTAHGQFPIGFTISPSLYDLAPAALHWYYRNALRDDYYVAGPSGSGYMFPSKMPDDRLDAYLTQLNDYVDLTGLNIVNILDQGIMDNPKVYNKYMAQPNIDAVFYTGYAEKGDGRIRFSDNGKPIIEQRSVLWQGIDGGSDRGEERNVIAEINARPADPHSPDGYTFVFVHCWTKTQSNIKTVIDGLNPNVRVVAPDVFASLVRQNLGK